MLEKLEDIRRKYDEIRARLADPEFVQDHRAVRDAQKTLSEFEPIVAKIDEQRQRPEGARGRAGDGRVARPRRRALPDGRGRASGADRAARPTSTRT